MLTKVFETAIKCSLGHKQGGHCPGNQENLGKVRESEKMLKSRGRGDLNVT